MRCLEFCICWTRLVWDGRAIIIHGSIHGPILKSACKKYSRASSVYLQSLSVGSPVPDLAMIIARPIPSTNFGGGGGVGA